MEVRELLERENLEHRENARIQVRRRRERKKVLLKTEKAAKHDELALDDVLIKRRAQR